jgi:hypothetical protein
MTIQTDELKTENIHAHYELIKTCIAGNAHGLHLILEVPLKTTNQIFNLYRIFTLPTKVFNHTFARYELDFDYFGLTYNQRPGYWGFFPGHQTVPCALGSTQPLKMSTRIFLGVKTAGA